MVIRNETHFTKESMEGAMRASNFDNNRYKLFKVIYNIFGYLFGIMLVRYLVLWVSGADNANIPMIIFYAIVTAVFLYIGMYGMDRDNKKRFNKIYGRMIGVKFTYEIDADTVSVTDEENDKDIFTWDSFTHWTEDKDNFYLFVNTDNCLVVSKEGFTECEASDFKELATAVFGLRTTARD